MDKQQNFIEVLLKRVGGQDRYQRALFVMFVCKWFFSALLMASLGFFYTVPELNCTHAEAKEFNTCYQFVCSHSDPQFWHDHLRIDQSLSMNYGILLICSNQWIADILESMSYIGAICGYLAVSIFGEVYGLRKTELICWIITLIGQIVLLSSSNLEMVGVGSFFIGFGVNSATAIHFSLIKELVLGIMRQKMLLAIQIPYTLGILLIAIIAPLISSWKLVLGVGILAPSVLLTFGSAFTENNLIFSFKKGEGTLLHSINRIALINKKEEVDLQSMIEKLKNFPISYSSRNLSIVDLFRLRVLLRITVICAFGSLWLAFVYAEISRSVKSIGIYARTNEALFSILEVVSQFFSISVIHKIKRKVFVSNGFFVIGVLTVVLGIEKTIYTHTDNILDWHSMLIIILAGIIRFVVGIIRGVLVVFISELFPREVSSLSFMWIGASSALGSIFPRYLSLELPLVLTGFCLLMGAILIRTLPETKMRGFILSDSVSERKKSRVDRFEEVLTEEQEIKSPG